MLIYVKQIRSFTTIKFCDSKKFFAVFIHVMRQFYHS